MSLIEKIEAYEPPDPSGYVPIRATFHLATPMMIKFPWLHGDGLLAKMLLEEQLGRDYHKLDGKKPLHIWKWLHLPLSFSHQVYHASAVIFDTDVHKTLTIYKRFHEDPRLHLKSRLRVGSGYFRAYQMQMPYVPANTVSFFFHGDLVEVSRLLGYVRSIGAKHAIGGGEVIRCDIEEMPIDSSLVCDGHIMRSIPSRELKEFSLGQIMTATYRFPYWDAANAVLCVTPGSEGALG